MPDNLTITGGGTQLVTTSALREHSARLMVVSGHARLSAARLVEQSAELSPAQLHATDAPASAFRARHEILGAAQALRELHNSCETLRVALHLSSASYSLAEQYREQLFAAIMGDLAYAAGLIVPAVFLSAAPSLVWVAGAVGVGGVLMGAHPESVQQGKKALSDPRLVAALRAALSSTDDFEAGVRQLPPALRGLLGESGMGVLGIISSAAALIRLGSPLGKLRETPVVVQQVGPPVAVQPATTFSGRAARVPRGAEQVRIDTYSSPGLPDRFEVFVGGTQDFSPVAETEPWDMTSNIAGIAHHSAGSYRATEEALRMAGATPHSEVLAVGYSQGGLVAGQLRHSDEFQVTGVLTFGAPVGAEQPGGTPWVAIEHPDDLVPALGGNHQDTSKTVVERQVFPVGTAPIDTPVAAHAFPHYAHTAQLLDQQFDPRTTGALEGFNRSGRDRPDETVTSSIYLAKRSPP